MSFKTGQNIAAHVKIKWIVCGLYKQEHLASKGHRDCVLHGHVEVDLKKEHT